MKSSHEQYIYGENINKKDTMPHCILEYSNDLDNNEGILKTVQMVNQSLIDSELFDNSTIKIRAMPISTYIIGGLQVPFIHTTMRLLAGRTDTQKQVLSRSMLNVLTKEYNLVKDISVEISDINPNCYSKI